MTDTHDDLPPLYCAYNGFMLGQFVHQCHLSYTAADYPRLVRRIREFLAELEISHRFPNTQQGYQTYVDAEPHDPWAEQLYRLSVTLGTYCWLGQKSTEYLLRRALGRRPEDEEMTRLFSTSEQLGVPGRILEELAARLPENPEHADVPVSAVLGVSLQYLGRLLDAVDEDERVAFVAMPFADPFLDRFYPYYAAGLAVAGYRAVRAWGSLSDEPFTSALMQLIDKCGWVVADITGRNENVLYEVGLAHGLGKQVSLVMEQAGAGEEPVFALEPPDAELPANLGEFWLRPYFPERRDWLEEAVSGLHMMIVLTKAGLAMRDENGLPPSKQKLEETVQQAMSELTPVG